MTTCLRCKSGKPTVCTSCVAELIDGATADLGLSEAAEPSAGRERVRCPYCHLTHIREDE